MQRPSPVAPTRQDRGTYLDIVTAPQPLGPLGPMAQVITVEIRDADLIFLQTLTISMREVPSCYGSHTNNTTKGITKWINNLCEESDMPADSKHVTIHCKAGFMSVRLVFETRSKCQDFVVRYEDDGIPYEINSPFCSVTTTITVRQSKSLEDRELVSNLRPCGERWLISSKFSSLMMMKVHLSSQRSTPAHQSSASRIEETGLENLCSNLPLLEADSSLLLLHLTCVFLVFLVKCCNGFSLKPTRPLCDGRSLASPLCRRLAGRGAFFSGFPFRWVLRFVLSLTRCLTVQDTISCSGENPLHECGRPV